MKFTVLGSGTSVPHPQRSSSGFWLETSGGSLLLDCSASAVHRMAQGPGGAAVVCLDTSGGSLLLDCSASAVHRMAQETLDWANLDAIWISHFHLDHVGGLPSFLFGTKYASET